MKEGRAGMERMEDGIGQGVGRLSDGGGGIERWVRRWQCEKWQEFEQQSRGDGGWRVNERDELRRCV